MADVAKVYRDMLLATELGKGMRSIAMWNSTDNPSSVKKTSIMYSAHRLIQALQTEFRNGQIAIPSQDVKDSRKGVEIAVMFHPLNRQDDLDIAAFLTDKAKELQLPFNNFVIQAGGLTTYYTHEQLGYLQKLGQKINDSSEIDEAYFEKIVTQAENAKSNLSDADGMGSFKDVPKSQSAGHGITLCKEKMERLRGLQGETLKNEIQNMLIALAQAAKMEKTGLSTYLMVSSGVGPVFAPFIDAAGLIKEELDAYHLSSYAAVQFGVDFVTKTADIITEIIEVAGNMLFLASKGARNILLVVNNTTEDIIPLGESIGNGERTGVTKRIKAANPIMDQYFAGIYVYDKWTLNKKATGFFGSCFGISFTSKLGDFSAGMDCPNSILGGRNSIALLDREHAPDAMVDARDNFRLDHNLYFENRRITACIADSMGNVNWGRIIVDEIGFAEGQS